MLSYYRINDPYRLIGVFLILILFRLPFWLSDSVMTIPQLTWIIDARRLSEGAMMYSGVWDTLSPLSAGFYWIIYSVFGESFVVIQILSVLLIFLQTTIFNTILINSNAFTENTYIPAIVYVVLASLYFDFFTVSPVMLGITFILLAMNNVFGQIEVRAKRDEKLLSTGIYLGLAALFHFPFFVFGLITLLIFVLFTATICRRYFLYMFGLVLPFLLVVLYYFYNDSLGLFWKNHITSWFLLETKVYISNRQVLLMIGYVAFFLMLSILRIFQRGRITNYQSRLIQAVFFMMVLSASILFIETDRNAFVFLTFVPTSAFFISHFFTLSKKGLVGELIFTIFILTTGFINYKSLADSDKEGLFDVSSYFVQKDRQYEKLEGKRISLLEDNVEAYLRADAATPFINWRLSKEVWEYSRKYENLILIANSIENDKPEVIVDPNGLLPKFFKQAPKLEQEYIKEGQFYFRKSNN